MTKAIRALLVEDSENDALLLVRELTGQGYELVWERVQSASDMGSALSEKSWDAVISDFNMPGFSAPEALKLTREFDDDLPFIVVSGTIGEDVAVETMKAGAHDYLLKGNLARLGQAIEREMRDAGIRREHRLATEKIKHLNRVLRSIRNVNQLIVTEKEPIRLVEKTCDLLIETRGYTSALIVRTDSTGQPSFVVHRTLGDESTQQLEEAIQLKGLPTCMRQALTSTDPMIVERDTADCVDCPLHSVHSNRRRLIEGMVHNDTCYGVFAVSLPEEVNLDAEVLELFDEMVGDIAFALNAIELGAALSAEHERHRTLLFNLPGMSYRGRPDWRADLLINAERLSGYTDDEVKSLENGWYSIVHPDDRAKILETSTVLGKQHQSLVREYRILDKTGHIRFVQDYATSVFAPDDRFLGIDGIVFDITERKNMQAQLAQADRLSSMGMLAAGVAHEINNPLSYVLYNLESLSEDLPAFIKAVRNYQSSVIERFGADAVEQAVGDASGELHRALFRDLLDRFRDSLEGTHRIRDITRGLSTFSRVERDELEPVDLRHVIDAALSMCFNEIKYRARVVKDYGRVPSVMGSQGRLSQVFLNLFVNAAHAIDEGDVEGNEIRVRTWTEGEIVCAEIRDTGKGIAPEHIHRLFEPFFTTKDVGVGSGLGLPISKGIVEGYGGEITVESSVGQGTAFIIRLPRQVEEAMSQLKAVEGEDSDRVWGRILVVDDEEAIRGAMVHMLRGHETVEASTGQVAKNILEEDQAFDLILSDLMMPEVSGMELHAWLSKEHPHLARQVIFITGGAFTPKARDYLSKVDNLRLEKPFDITNFKRIVSELIWREKLGRDTIGTV